MELFSIITEDLDHCYICGAERQQIHHCMNGSNKTKSEKYGLLLPVCAKCHNKIHDKDDNMKRVRKITQRKFEQIYSRELWLSEFGKSYLWEEE